VFIDIITHFHFIVLERSILVTLQPCGSIFEGIIIINIIIISVIIIVIIIFIIIIVIIVIIIIIIITMSSS